MKRGEARLYRRGSIGVALRPSWEQPGVSTPCPTGGIRCSRQTRRKYLVHKELAYENSESRPRKKYTRFDCSLNCPVLRLDPCFPPCCIPLPPFRIVRVQPSRMIKILLAAFLYRVFPSFFLSFLPSFIFPLLHFSCLPIRVCVRIN